MHATHVFTYEGHPIGRMLTSGWIQARRRLALPQVRVHDLKHTFGRRLRAAGVSFEDRQDLLGHRSGRITTHYSAAELVTAASRRQNGCATRRTAVPNWWCCGARSGGSRKTPANGLSEAGRRS